MIAPGGIIGRLPSAALYLDDPRVSEAHALVSLRGGALVMLALRGRLKVGGERVARVKLREGLVVGLVSGLALTVTELVLPAEVPAVRLGEGPLQTLAGAVYSALAGPPPALVTGYQPGAAAHLWAAADGWRFRVAGEPDARPLVPGEALAVGGAPLTVVARPSRLAGTNATSQAAEDAARLTLIARYETAHLHDDQGRSLRLPGIAARIVSELVQYNAPAPWEMVARTIWPDGRDRHALRQVWDRQLVLLRRRLRGAGLRPDVVRPDGCGNIELYLLPGDRVVDET